MYDFAKGLSQSKARMNTKNLSLMILGPSGGGKSHLIGTLDVPTLYLYFSGEDHGPVAASIEAGDNLLPYCLDVYDGKQLTPDETYKHLLAILANKEQIKARKIEFVTIDGATELEIVIRSSEEFKKRTTNHNGKQDNWLEPTATIDMFRPVVMGLKNLQTELNIHFAVTCILDVKSMGENGEMLETSPRLKGYAVAEALIQQFPEVIPVGRMQNDEMVGHRIQMMTRVTKSSKDKSGIVKRAVNYNPRITGVSADKLPSIMPADLKEVLALKRGE